MGKGKQPKRWIIAIAGETMTKKEARAEAEAILLKKGAKLYLAEIKEEITEEGWTPAN